MYLFVCVCTYDFAAHLHIVAPFGPPGCHTFAVAASYKTNSSHHSDHSQVRQMLASILQTHVKYVYFDLSIYLSTYLSIYLFIVYLPINLYLKISIYVYRNLYHIYIYIHIYMYISISRHGRLGGLPVAHRRHRDGNSWSFLFFKGTYGEHIGKNRWNLRVRRIFT